VSHRFSFEGHLMPFQGEFAALATACCWVITAMSFESAGKRIGSLAVNLIRLVMAFGFLAVLGLVSRGLALPTDADAHNWLWLSLSGLAGFTLGDLALFRAFVLIGARRAILLMSFVPPLAALLGWFILDERLSVVDLTGMALTVAGVALAVLERRPENGGVRLKPMVLGVALGLVGALGQAVGLVLSKYGMKDFDPFAATQIRVIAGAVGFAALFSLIGWWPKVFTALKDTPAMKRVTLGAFFGPFLGVSLSLMALQYIKTGVAATLMATTPVLILAPAAIVFKEHVTPRAILGALLAVIGVCVLVLL
jgi:drug/metabolite transporter (DMT)-like permease